MEIFAVADVATVATSQGLVFDKIFLHRNFCYSSNHISVYSNSLPEPYSSTGVFSISAGITPVDTIAPPVVRSASCRTAPRTLIRKKRRMRKRSLKGDSDGGEDIGFFGDSDNGPFGGGGGNDGGGGRSGGRGWNFDRSGDSNWEGSSPSFSDPAFVFFYEVVSWIALSKCMHFAFKKVVRIVGDGIGDPSREKVPMRLVSMY